MKAALACLVFLAARPASADDDPPPPDRVRFAMNMTVGALFSQTQGERSDSLAMVGYTFGATFPLGKRLDLFAGLGVPFGVSLTVHAPVRLDWAPRGRRRSGPVLHAGVRPMFTDVAICSSDLRSCPQAYQDMVDASDDPHHPGPPIHALAATGEVGVGYQWAWRSVVMHVSGSYLGGYVRGVKAPFDPIAGYYQGFVVQLGGAGR